MCKRIPVNALNPFRAKKNVFLFQFGFFFFFFLFIKRCEINQRGIPQKWRPLISQIIIPQNKPHLRSVLRRAEASARRAWWQRRLISPPPFPLKCVSPLLPDVCILHISSPSGQIPTINSYMNYLYFCCRQFLKLWAFRSWLTITNPEIGMCTFSIRAKAFYCIINDILSFSINNISACNGFRQLFSAPAGGEERVSTNSFINYIASGSKTGIPTP